MLVGIGTVLPVRGPSQTASHEEKLVAEKPGGFCSAVDKCQEKRPQLPGIDGAIILENVAKPRVGNEVGRLASQVRG